MPYNGKTKSEYNNELAREKYDRIAVVVPKGFRNEIKRRADQIGLSVNAYIIGLIRADMDAAETGNSRED